MRTVARRGWLDPSLTAGVVVPDPFAGWDPRLPISAFHERATQATERARQAARTLPAGSAWSSGSSDRCAQHSPVALADGGPEHEGRLALGRDQRLETGALPAYPRVSDAAGGAARVQRRQRIVATANHGGEPQRPKRTAREAARALLRDETANGTQLRRALQSLLRESDAMADTTAAQAAKAAADRILLATELCAFAAPLLREAELLRRRERFWGGGAMPADKFSEAKGPMVEAGPWAHDVLRSAAGARSSVADDAARGSLSASRAPIRVPVASAEAAAAELAASLTRREHGRAASALAAAVGEAEAGAPEALLGLLGDAPFVSAAAARALDQALLDMAPERAMGLRMRVHAAGGEAMLVRLLTAPATATDAAGRRKTMAVQLAALNALEALVEGCPPVCTGFVDTGGGPALASLLAAGSAIHPTPTAAALLPHALHLLIALGGASRAGATEELRRAGCVAAVIPLLDRGLSDRTALLGVAALKATGERDGLRPYPPSAYGI